MSSRKYIVLKLVAFLLIFNSVNTQSEVTQAEYDSLSKISLSILNYFPPDKYFYIGPGRSPTPIIAFFNQLSAAMAKTIPISFTDDFGDEIFYESKRHSVWMRELFERFLPTKNELGERRVLVVDYVISGHSLYNFSSALVEFIRTNRNAQVDILALTDKPIDRPLRDKFKKLNLAVEFLLLGDYGQMSNLFMDARFKDVAEYGLTIPLSQPVSSISKRPEYEALISQLRSFMLTDARLKRLKLNDRIIQQRLGACAKLAAELEL